MIDTLTVNESVKLYFQAAPGITNFSGLVVLNNGTLVPTPNISATGTVVPGVYVITYQPTSTGRGVITFNDTIVAQVEVVTKGLFSYLKNIEDEAIGSWSWDKQQGTLQMTRQDGSVLANFDVTENITAAIRERTS
jgi:hypothetical protein